MSSIFEKITLYDFFCYLIPGVTFEALLAIVLVAVSWDTFLEIMKQISSYTGFLTVGILLFGYLAGILLSELSRWFSNKGKKDSFYQKVADRSGCSAQVICRALVNGGMITGSAKEQMRTQAGTQVGKQSGNGENREANEDTHLEAPVLIERYINAMRGVLQSDQNYKRIHDYSSFATMCKNLAAAFAAAGVIDVWFIAARYGVPQAAVAVSAGITPSSVLAAVFALMRVLLPVTLLFVVVARVFWIRYRRFEVKTGTYIVIWYVEKETYAKKEESKKTAAAVNSQDGDPENKAQ